jgi:hypothetical protein
MPKCGIVGCGTLGSAPEVQGLVRASDSVVEAATGRSPEERLVFEGTAGRRVEDSR